MGGAARHVMSPVSRVGRDRAARIHESGLVPREWLWMNVIAPSLEPTTGRAV